MLLLAAVPGQAKKERWISEAKDKPPILPLPPSRSLKAYVFWDQLVDFTLFSTLYLLNPLMPMIVSSKYGTTWAITLNYYSLISAKKVTLPSPYCLLYRAFKVYSAVTMFPNLSDAFWSTPLCHCFDFLRINWKPLRRDDMAQEWNFIKPKSSIPIVFLTHEEQAFIDFNLKKVKCMTRCTLLLKGGWCRSHCWGNRPIFLRIKYTALRSLSERKKIFLLWFCYVVMGVGMLVKMMSISLPNVMY